MSSHLKPAIVLVHGSWHVPKHYLELTSQLRRAGFDVFVPHLPTCDETERQDADLYRDAHLVRVYIARLVDKSRDVILLLHSYGGAVGTEAAKGLAKSERARNGLAGGITHLIYMCGFMLQVGESVGSASLPRPVPDPVELDEATGTTFLSQPPRELFYGDLTPAHATQMEKLLVRQSGAAMAGTITYPAWRDIPATYLLTLDDRVLFPKWQERQIKAVRDTGASVTVKSLESSHSPFLSMPGAIVAVVENIK